MRTLEEIQKEYSETFKQKETIVAEYRATHTLPSRGVIDTPEISALREKLKALTEEYLKTAKYLEK